MGARSCPGRWQLDRRHRPFDAGLGGARLYVKDGRFCGWTVDYELLVAFAPATQHEGGGPLKEIH
jgi:hypothetical protein